MIVTKLIRALNTAERRKDIWQELQFSQAARHVARSAKYPTNRDHD